MADLGACEHGLLTFQKNFENGAELPVILQKMQEIVSEEESYPDGNGPARGLLNYAAWLCFAFTEDEEQEQREYFARIVERAFEGIHQDPRSQVVIHALRDNAVTPAIAWHARTVLENLKHSAFHVKENEPPTVRRSLQLTAMF